MRAAATGPGRKVVAVIGIDRYHHWGTLQNAVSDASGARSLFGWLGFEELTAPLLDEHATGAAIQRLVTDDLLSLREEDSIVLFYAGHGGTRTQYLGRRPVRTGYLIPVDGTSQQVSSWIDLDAWLRQISKLPAKHILVILDACYSGIALSSMVRWGRDAGAETSCAYEVLEARRSRLVITAALDDERALDHGPVPGHSLFTGCLIEGLTSGLVGQPSRDGMPTITGSDLARHVRRRVQTYPGHQGWRQTPDFGCFDYDERGEMLLPVLTPPLPTRSEGWGDTIPDELPPTAEPSASHPSDKLVASDQLVQVHLFATNAATFEVYEGSLKVSDGPTLLGVPRAGTRSVTIRARGFYDLDLIIPGTASELPVELQPISGEREHSDTTRAVGVRSKSCL